MANIKISQLPAAPALTGDDLLPVVENSAGQTQKATLNDVLDFVTGSTFDTLTVTALSGGTVVADIEISGNIGAASYSITSADQGKTLLFSSSSPQAITCSSGLQTGFNVTCVQLGGGQLDFSGSGVTLVNRFAHTSSAGLYSAVSVVVLNASQYLLVGDTN